MKILCSTVVICATILLSAKAVFAQCALVQKNGQVTLSNEFVQMTFSPATGGKCAGFLLKDANWELTKWPESQAFEDRLWNVGIGYDLPEASYSLTIVKNTAEEASIRLSGRPKTPGMTALRVDKEITLRKGSRRIDVVFRCHNEGAQALPVALWSSHGLMIRQEPVVFQVPVASGIETAFWQFGKNPADDPRNKAISLPDRASHAPSRGWQAMVGASGCGLVWNVPEDITGFAYQYLSSQTGTLEAIFNEIQVAPGKELAIPTSFIALKGLPMVNGAGAPGAGAIHAPDKVDANAEVNAKVSVLPAMAGNYVVKAIFKPMLIKGEPQALEQKVALTVEQPKDFSFKFTPQLIGTHVLQVTVTDSDGRSFDMERPVIVGAASGDYVFRPKVEQVGRPNPAWLDKVRGATAQTAKSAEVVQKYVKGLGLEKPLNLDWLPTAFANVPQFAGEPPRVLFCESLFQSHQAVRAIKQAEMRYDHAIIMVPKAWYFLGSVSRSEKLWEPCIPILTGKLRSGSWDVIVWTSDGAQWKQLPEDVQKLLLDAVRVSGASLLYAANAEDMKDVPEAFGVKLGAPSDPTAALGKTLPDQKTRFQEMQVAQAGKGRILLYPHTRKTAFFQDPDALAGTPQTVSLPVTTLRHFSYSDFARAIYFAAGRTTVAQPKISMSSEIAQADLAAKPLAQIGADAACTMEAVVRDLRLNPVFEAKFPVSEKNAAQVRVPHLAAGGYVLDVRTLDKDGKVYGWRSATFKVSSLVSLALAAPDVVDKGEKIVVAIEVDAQPDDAIRLDVQDTEGRLVFSETTAAQKGQDVVFEVPTQDALTKIVIARATLVRNKVELTVSEKPVAVRLHRVNPFRFAELWRNWEWSKEYFHTDTFCGTARATAWSNMDNILWGTGAPEGFNLEKQSVETLVRQPCLSDPQYLETTAKWIKERVVSPPQAQYEELGMIWSDEWNYPSVRDMETNFCHSPSCLARLRESLKEQYKTIGALNEEWGTAYKDWQEATPPTLAEVKKEPDRWAAAWSDHRHNQDMVVRDYFDFVNNTAREIYPQARIGLSGTRNPNAFNGMDWWHIMQSNRFLSSYAGPQIAYSRSFKSPQGYLSSWIGYDDVGLGDARAEAQIWSNLFNGRDGVISYTTGHSPLFYGDGEPRPSGIGNERALRTVQGGISHLIKSAQADNSGVAVLYSMADVRAATLDSYRGGRFGIRQFGNNQQSLFALLENLGLSYDAIATEQVEAGKLGEYRLLILGYGVAMSPEVARQIRDFVAAGGTVVADVAPATRDGHCKPLARGALDDLFGVDQGSMKPSLTMVELKTQDDSVQVAAGIPDLRVTTGKALAHWTTDAAPSPAIVINEFGKGHAVLLNFMVHDYSTFAFAGVGGELSVVAQAKQKKVDSIQKIFQGIFSARGISPKTALTLEGKPFLKPSIYNYRLGEADYIGIMPRELPIENCPVDVTFAREGWVYDCVAKEALSKGPVRQISVKLNQDRARFLAVLPNPVESLRMTTVAEARQGETVTVNIERVCKSAEKAFCEMQVIRPDGKKVWLLRQIVALEGNRATARLPFALNDPLGSWKVIVVDAATGARTEATIILRQP